MGRRSNLPKGHREEPNLIKAGDPSSHKAATSGRRDSKLPKADVPPFYQKKANHKNVKHQGPNLPEAKEPSSDEEWFVHGKLTRHFDKGIVNGKMWEVRDWSDDDDEDVEECAFLPPGFVDGKPDINGRILYRYM